MTGTDPRTSLRDMWETRPARPRSGRQVAGVAAGLGRRYAVDPVLIRVAFAVAAFYGIGIVLYLLCWLVLPGGTDESRRTPRAAALVGVGVLTLVGLSSALGTDGRGWLLPTLAALGLLYLLHHSRGRIPMTSGTSPDAEPAPPAPATPLTVGRDLPTTPVPASTSTSGPSATATEASVPEASGSPDAAVSPAAVSPDTTVSEQTTVPQDTAAYQDTAAFPNLVKARDGSGAGAPDGPEPPDATWLPDPTPDPAARPHRTPVTAITLAVALLAGGITALVLLGTGSLSPSSLPPLSALVLAVLGAGLVIGAFLRSGRGLIPIAVVMSVLTWALVAAPLENWPDGIVGDAREAPASVAALAPGYSQSAGSFVLDLRRLDLDVTPGGDPGPVRTSIAIGAGDVQVQVPPDADVRFAGRAGLGSVRFDGREGNGFDAALTTTTGPGTDRSGTTRPLEITVTANLGSVEVRRG